MSSTSETVYVVVRQCTYSDYSPYTSTIGVFKDKNKAYAEAAKKNMEQALKNFCNFPHLVKHEVIPGLEKAEMDFWYLDDVLPSDIIGKDNKVDMESFLDLMEKNLTKLIEKGECQTAYELSDYLISEVNFNDIDAESQIYIQVEESNLI